VLSATLAAPGIVGLTAATSNAMPISTLRSECVNSPGGRWVTGYSGGRVTGYMCYYSDVGATATSICMTAAATTRAAAKADFKNGGGPSAVRPTLYRGRTANASELQPYRLRTDRTWDGRRTYECCS
jgi:hypothetical protein